MVKQVSYRITDLKQGKLNIAPGWISTVGTGKNLGRFYHKQQIFYLLINKLDFHGTKGSPILPICIQ